MDIFHVLSDIDSSHIYFSQNKNANILQKDVGVSYTP